MGVKVKTTQVAANTTTGTQDITIAGFGQVKFFMVLATSATSTNTDTDDAHWSFGLSDDASQRSVWAMSEDGATTTDTDRSMETDEIVTLWALDGSSKTAAATFDSFIDDGVRINWTVAASSAYLMTFVFFGGSNLTVQVGSGNHNGAQDAAQSFTGIGFQSDLILFAGNTGPEDPASTSQPAQVTIGFGNSTAQAAVGQSSEDGAGAADTFSGVFNDRVLIAWNPAIGTIARYLELTSIDPDGFTLTKRSQGFNTPFYYAALHFGGAARSWVSTFTGPSTTGDFSNTDAGFVPQFLALFPMLASTVNTIEDTNANGAGQWSIGIMDGTNEYAVSYTEEDGATTTDTQSLVDTKAINQPGENSSASDEYVGTWQSFDDNGFTVNLTTNTPGARIWAGFAIEEAPRRIYIS